MIIALRNAVFRLRFSAFVLLLATLAGLSLAPAPVLAQGVGASSGLPLPRFVSVRNAPANVRVGPGTRYEAAWVFVRSGVPVEIVQEFDTWRKIRDVDGAEGWLHQNLLVGNRTALVAPWDSAARIPLRANENPSSAVRAWLTPNLLVGVRRCTGVLCEIRFTHTGPDGRNASYQGFVAQTALWGVYEGEVFD